MILKYFKTSFIVLVAGILLVMGIVWWQTQSVPVVLQAGFTALLLSVLEISLSFDNAVVNATIIKKMSPVWKQRFLTWGMLIAVFGMRLLFPLIIVSMVAHIDPISAFQLSFSDPVKYAEIMTSAHLSVASFGGMFLLMVFIHFFVNSGKELHWISFVEKPLKKISEFKGIELVISLVAILSLSGIIQGEDSKTYLISGLWGVVTFLLVHSLADWLEDMDIIGDSKVVTASSGLGLFLYLEVLDASFSFDGVIGAFALTNSLIQIMIGLSIGAFFVRSLTIYFVEKDTLEQFKFLEHGAFYALGALAILMLLDPFVHIPEWVTGLTGASILAISVLWSIHIDRQSGTAQN
jgi:uncharacterized protein